MLKSPLSSGALIRQVDTPLFEKVLFERPINRLRARNLVLLAGRHTHLRQINDAYQLINALNHHPVLIAAHALRTRAVPAEIFLQPDKKTELHFANTDQVVEAVSNAAFAILGLELEIGSKYQILIERIIQSCRTPIIATNSFLPVLKTSKAIMNGHSGVFVLDTEHLMSLASLLDLSVTFKRGAGLNNKLGLMQQLSDYTGWPIVCYEATQILSYSPRQTRQAGVTNFAEAPKAEVEAVISSLLVSLLADSATWQTDFLERSLTATFLLRQLFALKKNNQDVGKRIGQILHRYQ